MNFDVKANLFGGQFSISHQLNNPDFNAALIATELLRNLKTHLLYGRVNLKKYTAELSSRIFAGMTNSDHDEDSSCYFNDDMIHTFTGIVINVYLPDDYDIGGDAIGIDKRLEMYNCFIENYIKHMQACNTPAFFQYDSIRAVNDLPDSAQMTIMIPTFDSADGAFFDITKFSSLEGVTNIPHFQPFNSYATMGSRVFKVPESYHVEYVSLYSTEEDRDGEEWYVIVRDAPNP